MIRQLDEGTRSVRGFVSHQQVVVCLLPRLLKVEDVVEGLELCKEAVLEELAYLRHRVWVEFVVVRLHYGSMGGGGGGSGACHRDTAAVNSLCTSRSCLPCFFRQRVSLVNRGRKLNQGRKGEGRATLLCPILTVGAATQRPSRKFFRCPCASALVPPDTATSRRVWEMLKTVEIRSGDRPIRRPKLQQGTRGGRHCQQEQPPK